MTRLALFDLDNTLVDRQAAFRAWARTFVEDNGRPRSDVEWICQIDDDGYASREDVFTAIKERWGLNIPTERLLIEYRSSYPRHFRTDPPTCEALGRLRVAGWRIVVVTNGPPTQRIKLERAGITSLVDGWCISEDLGVAKPDPEIFEHAVRIGLGTPRQDDTIVMVGDSAAHDILGASRLGFRTVWLRRGRQWPAAAAAFTPDETVEDVLEAIAVLLSDEKRHAY